ncbi:hypothetical protein C2G38_540208 [Gigaspora rosea]|uniref:Uncharacterized protein n=1 Tax=Gigaspora rosea TaxID=44941 RepID=A0A397U7B9_9GLOM|nr:hypothetical protein C2G38_540208 [Gigaspora rosea]
MLDLNLIFLRFYYQFRIGVPMFKKALSCYMQLKSNKLTSIIFAMWVIVLTTF